MPNHVKNILKIKGIPKDKIDYVLNKLAIKYEPDFSDKEEWIIDFDLIIPEPRFKKDCPKDCIVNKDSHVSEVEGRPWFNWYEWHLKYWGTKWNAYEGYTIIGKTQLTFVFCTAWTIPDRVYDRLCDLGYNLEVRFADEDIGSNCGVVKFNASEPDKLDVITERELKYPEKFAKYIWDKY